MDPNYNFNVNNGAGTLGVKPDWQNDVTPQVEETKEEQWEWDEKRFKWVLGGDDVEHPVNWNTNDTRIQLDNLAFQGSGIQSLTEVQEYSHRIAVFNIPIYGRIQFVKHKPGYIHLSIIVLYWLYGNWSTFTYFLGPHGYEDHISPIWTWGKHLIS